MRAAESNRQLKCICLFDRYIPLMRAQLLSKAFFSSDISSIGKAQYEVAVGVDEFGSGGIFLADSHTIRSVVFILSDVFT